MKKCQGKSNLEIVSNYLNNERPFLQVGYEGKKEKKHKDGDTWKDRNGTEWIQKGPTKISKKLYDLKESTRQLCSICNKDIYWAGNRYDQQFFNKTGKCYDCVIEEEHKMKIDGTYDIYEKLKIIRNQKSFLSELKLKLIESIAFLKNSSNKLEYLNEDGSTDSWTDTNREFILNNAENDLIQTNEALIRCDESIKSLEAELNIIIENNKQKNESTNK